MLVGRPLWRRSRFPRASVGSKACRLHSNREMFRSAWVSEMRRVASGSRGGASDAMARADAPAVERDLRSVRSARRWQRPAWAWLQDGPRALASTGSTSLALLVLEQELANRLAAHGWPDQTWTSIDGSFTVSLAPGWRAPRDRAGPARRIGMPSRCSRRLSSGPGRWSETLRS